MSSTHKCLQYLKLFVLGAIFLIQKRHILLSLVSYNLQTNKLINKWEDGIVLYHLYIIIFYFMSIENSKKYFT